MTTTTEAPATLTRAEAAYAHLASFQRGDEVDVGGRRFFQPGTVTIAQQHDHADLNRAALVVEGCGVVTRVSVASLLSGRYTITSRADARAGNVRYFDAATWAMRNPEPDPTELPVVHDFTDGWGYREEKADFS